MKLKGCFKKPIWTRLLAGFLWLNVLGMPIQVMIFFGHSPTEIAAIWAKLTPQNILLMGLSPFAALGIQRVTRWGWWAFMAFLTVALFNNIILLRFKTVVPVPLILLSTLLILSITMFFLRQDVIEFFCKSKLHWWKTAVRRRLTFPVKVIQNGIENVVGATFNISRTGCFFPSDSTVFQSGEMVRIQLGIGKRALECVASVVRYTEGCETYPSGFGFRFENITMRDQLRLRTALRG